MGDGGGRGVLAVVHPQPLPQYFGLRANFIPKKEFLCVVINDRSEVASAGT